MGVYSFTPTCFIGKHSFVLNFIGTSDAYTQDSTELEMEAYAYFNAFASYAVTEKQMVSVAANNLFDDFGATEVEEGSMGGRSDTVVKVTIFARGGFPHFESDEMRRGVDYMSERIRYVYIPGGGETFIRKEDISVALDEQLNWVFEFCRSEAAARKCQPWELYEFINSHYWDAAVLVVGLVDRWRNLIVERSLNRLLRGVVSEATFEELNDGLHWRALGGSPDFYFGRMLFYHVRLSDQSIEQQVRAAASL